MKGLIIGIIGIVGSMLPLLGQQFGLPHVERYTISEGLSNNSVFSLVQDSIGFLWIATGDGLNRYDGYTFSRFRHQANDPASLAENHISSLTLGTSGALWIGTQVKGINGYDIPKGVFRPPQTGPEDELFIHPGYTLLPQADSGLVIATNQGVYSLNSSQMALLGASVRCLLPLTPTTFLAGSNEGLHILGKDLTQPHLFLPSERVGSVRALAWGKDSSLYLGTEEGLFVVNPKRPQGLLKIPDYQARLNQINAIRADKHGHLWVGGDNGLVVIDAASNRPLRTENEVLGRNGLDQERVECLFIDREDNLWIGTASDGLIRLFLSGGHFPLYRPAQHLPTQSPVGNTIRSALAEGDGTLWLGSYGGWLYKYQRSQDSRLGLQPESYPLSDNIISALYRDAEGKLWVGTWNNGLFQAIEQNGSLRFMQHPYWNGPGPGQQYLQSIQRLFEDRAGNMWVITNGGLLRKRKGASHFTEATDFFPQSASSINAFWEDKKGNWWIGTWYGLYMYEKASVEKAQVMVEAPKEGLVPTIIFRENMPDSLALSDNRVTALLEDGKGDLWVGTYGGGLNRIRSEKVKAYSEQDGLPNTIIYGVETDSLDRLWISTNDGLALFDPGTDRFRIFTEDDGLQNNQFYFGAHAKMPDGQILMGGIKGFNLFLPETYSLEGPKPPVVTLTGLEIRGESVPIGAREDGTVVLDSAILLSKEILLQPYDNAFRLNFSALTFNHATKLRFAYRLEGFEEEWRITDYQNRFAVFGQLYEGSYTFQVKASLNGYQFGPVRSLSIRVLPPWYRTWWAYSLMGLLALLIILGVARISYVYSHLQNQLELAELRREKEAEIYNLRLWFFTGISHEFRTPLTLILSPLNELLGQFQLPTPVRNKLGLMQRSSQRLLRLVNQILNLRRLNAGELVLEAAEQDIVAFARDIFFSFYDHADTRGLKYEFTCEKEEIRLWFDAEKMEIILYNLLSNAFKYSRTSGTVRLQLIEGDREAQLLVTDEGIGIEPERIGEIFQPFRRVNEGREYSGFGIGLALVKSLVELHKGRIEVQSTPAKGTAFSLYFPLGDMHLALEERIQRPIHHDYTRKSPSYTEGESFSVFPDQEGVSRPTLLLVEDERELRSYIAEHFSAEFEVLQAANGEEGLTLAMAHIPDLIISDVMMPIMDGIALCRRLSEELSTRQIPLILLTARTALPHQVQGLQSGAIAYIAKPVDIALLRERVIAILRNVRQMQQAYRQEGILPLETNLLSRDEKFVRKAAQIVEQHLATPQLNAQFFADQMDMSRSNLYKKLMATADKSPTQFIRYIRLRHAEKLLKEGVLNISETAYKVGFGDLKYFRRCFKEEFGVSPSEFVKRLEG